MVTQRRRQLQARGFDRTTVIRGRGVPTRYRPACSQCEVLVINGLACHETGCPHAMHECKGCNVQIPRQQRYCEDCQ